MDPQFIRQAGLIDQYLGGKLAAAEQKKLEQALAESPGLAGELGLPEILRRVVRLIGDGTILETPPRRIWETRWFLLTIATIAVLAIVAVAVLWRQQRIAEAEHLALEKIIAVGSLVAPTRLSIIEVSPASPSRAPTVYHIGNRYAPSLAELRIDLRNAPGFRYTINIRRDDGTHWERIENLTRDSNGYLRLGVNTSTFAAGIYDLEIAAQGLLEDTLPVGRVRLTVDAR
jgi:hypothetical protein